MLDMLKQQILQGKYQRYQATFFFNRTDSRVKIANRLLSMVSLKTPNMIIDLDNAVALNRLHECEDRRIMDFSIIMEFDSDNVLRRIYNILDVLSQVLPKKKRKRTLVVLAGEFVPAVMKTQIFSYAWSKKFLDFSLVTRDYHESQATHEFLFTHYDPFRNVITEELITNKTNFFPEKLRDVNGYNLTLAVSSKDLESSIEYDKSGKIVNFESPQFPILRFIFKFMNFSFEFFEISSNMTNTESSSYILQKLDRNEISLVPVARGRSYSEKVHLIDLDSNCINIKATFPLSILKKESAHKIKSLTSLLFVSTLIIFVYWIVKISKIQRGNWELLDIFRIILGTPMANSPRNSIDRLLLAGIILVSSVFSNELYSQLLDVHYMRNKTKLDTFEKIERSKLKVNIPYVMANSPFWDSDKLLQKIRSKCQIIDNPLECLKRFDHNASQICIASEQFLKFYMSSEYKKYRNPAFEIAEPVFNCVRFRYAFERSSPFAKKFKRLYRRIRQYGLEKILLSTYDLRRKFTMRRENPDGKKLKSFPVQVLYIFLAFGYFISFFVFIVEIIYEISSTWYK
ncbi:hypothetical protein QAD02_006547 [Eretmocerus hayati]|uniref:Uncharacterized protein n=1 Tax=Eretmocerus hayati TaxID=131215 RepID=A0ACC2N162_9HYME|nr:hypothetical protein QAD02_006547 [Eretmocerus hayati]